MRLVVALEKIEEMLEETGWCQGARARDADGNPVDPGSYAVASRDLVGIVALVTRYRHGDGYNLDYDRLMWHLWAALNTNRANHAALRVWHDEPGRTKGDVLELVRKARALAKVSAALADAEATP